MGTKTGGQRHRRAEEWRAIIDRQAKSGLSVRKFCERESLCVPSFYIWLKKLGTQGAAKEASFVELHPGNPKEVGGRVEVELPSGAILRIW